MCRRYIYSSRASFTRLKIEVRNGIAAPRGPLFALAAVAAFQRNGTNFAAGVCNVGVCRFISLVGCTNVKRKVFWFFI